MKQFGKLVLSSPRGHEQEFVLETSIVILGRGTTSDITLSDAKVSRAHARLECSDAGCTLIDLDSANGVRVNGERVEQAVLAPGDIIGLGDSTLRFAIDVPQADPDTIAINSEAELEATLAQETVPMTLTNTHVPRLVVHTPAQTWEVPLTQGSLSIGRHPANDLVLDRPQSSRHHARIERVGDGFCIRDLGSTNGTWRGTQRIEMHILQNGDTLRIGDTQLVFKSGFAVEELTQIEEPMGGRERVRPPVVFVPGMMGSELWHGSERLWPNVKVMFTEPEVFRFREGDALEARDIVSDVVLIPNLVKQQSYGRLGDYLEEALAYARGRDLLEFAYDWRQDVRLSAQRLAETIEQWAVSSPITLIAHSLGCLVSRYYIERLGGKHKVGRLILLGGPHSGHPKAVAHLLSGPDFLPFGLFGERMRQVIATFPATYQILPAEAYVSDQTGSPVDALSDEGWLAEQHRPLLRDARAFRRELGSHSSVPTVSIFGYGLKTVTGVRVERNRAGAWQNVDFDLKEGGDTAVPASSAVLSGSEIHPVQQHHGSLYVDNDVKMRLKLELTQ